MFQTGDAAPSGFSAASGCMWSRPRAASEPRKDLRNEGLDLKKKKSAQKNCEYVGHHPVSPLLCTEEAPAY